MPDIYHVDEVDTRIQQLKRTAAEIEDLAGNIQAVKKNLLRLKASIAMLELNISDVRLAKQM
ncbi:MAG TPA: hypothetical protein VHO84_12635 [Syntrophorhabdaceae bacterium]|nr:hypothetical protein [Syntrophorhabdaceae bacterium]